MNKFLDYVDVDPKTHLEKDKIYDFIEMKQVNPFTRKPSIVVKRKYIGQGCVFQEGDILLARITPSLEHGKCVFIKKLDTKVGFGSTEFFVLRPRNNDIDRLYLYYFCFEPRFRETLINSMVGASGRQRVNKDVLNEYEFDLPPSATQRKIASILLAYDDLIELNERRIKILEEIARLIYTQWFIKFRFPGYEKVKMVQSELGMIPEGWEVGQIKKILNIRSGYAFKSKFFTEEGINKIVRIGNVKEDLSIDIDSLQAIDLDLSEEDLNKFGLIEGDILLTLTGNVGRLSIVPKTKFKLFCNQRVAILDFLDKNYRYYIWFLFKSYAFNEQIINLAGGVAQANLSPVLLEQQLIIIPSEDIISVFNGNTAPIFEQTLTLVSQNNILRQTRDMLLPKLVRGKIDVSSLDIKLRSEKV